MSIKIATLNLCLGLPNKKNDVKKLIVENNIDILCMQETEIDPNMNIEPLGFPGYSIEAESSDTKIRTAIYIKNGVNYTRRKDLEIKNFHVVIVDLNTTNKLRLINIYRTFAPQDDVTPKEKFAQQLITISNAMTENCIIMGDFNIDWKKKNDESYAFKNYFEEMDKVAILGDLHQLVTFATWSRFYNGVQRSSIIDHIYCTDPLLEETLESFEPTFGDHIALLIKVNGDKKSLHCNQRRNWTSYTKEKLLNMLREVDWQIDYDDVQSFWNHLESKVLSVVDELVPMTTFINNTYVKEKTPCHIKAAINKRKRMLAKFKVNKSQLQLKEIKIINKLIKKHYHEEKTKRVKRSIVPGSSESIWKAVKIARDLNVTTLPCKMTNNGEDIEEEKLADKFAEYFDAKIRNLSEQATIDPSIYNGRKKINGVNKMFMDEDSVRECIATIKLKNTEGFDRIPQRILVDGASVLTKPMCELFSKIYYQRAVPKQWLVSKTMPIYKNKGEKKEISNYRPVAHLCSSSKIFEKLILKRIYEIQDIENVDLTGDGQHGFKKKRGTSTLQMQIQSILARATDANNYAIMASLDLSAAFDLVDIDLLMTRLKIIGFPADLLELVQVWLTDRSFYVTIDGKNSTLYDLLLGTVQGSILGPVLYAMFVCPLFDLVKMSGFADDNYVINWNKDLAVCIAEVENTLKIMTDWLKGSGMKVNESKTECCIFYKNDITTKAVMIGDTEVSTSKTINVLGVTFDSKLGWGPQVANAISKATRTLNGLKLIRKYFNTKELLGIVTSNFFSVLYYNCEVWMIDSLKTSLKKNLTTISASALRMCWHYKKNDVSYVDLHRISKRATPKQMSEYKLAIQLYKVFNDGVPNNEWINLNYEIVVTSRQSKFATRRLNNNRIGLNILVNRFHALNGKIPLDWLNLSLVGFKLKIKSEFLSRIN